MFCLLFSLQLLTRNGRVVVVPQAFEFIAALHGPISVFGSIFKVSNIDILFVDQLTFSVIRTIYKVPNVLLDSIFKLAVPLLYAVIVLTLVAFELIKIEPTLLESPILYPSHKNALCKLFALYVLG